MTPDLTPLDLILIVAAYLMGSLSTALVAARLMGLADPRSQGSGNPGATNMLRIGGRKAGVVTLLGDMLKGLVPVVVARLAGLEPQALALVALAAFLGHLYPVFFGFRGGKGVATALGVLLGLCWPVGVATIGTWLAVAGLTRISSLAALTAALGAPFYFLWLRPEPAFVTAAAVMAVLLYWRHRSNIRKLLAGTEGRIKLG